MSGLLGIASTKSPWLQAVQLVGSLLQPTQGASHVWHSVPVFAGKNPKSHSRHFLCASYVLQLGITTCCCAETCAQIEAKIKPTILHNMPERDLGGERNC